MTSPQSTQTTAMRGVCWRTYAAMQRHLGLVVIGSTALVVAGVAGVIATEG